MKHGVIVAAIMAVVATQAQAVTLQFKMADVSGTNYSWRAPQKPVPDDVFPNNGQFTLAGVAVDDSSLGTMNYNLLFSNDDCCFKFVIRNASNRSIRFYNGPAVFSGTPHAPTFLLGSFTFVASPGDDFFRPLDGGTLTISAVPEPAAWLSMLTGFGLLGGALRQRRAASARLARAV